MGDIADMILDGDLCELCSGCFEDEGSGHPRTCEDCRKNLQKEADRYDAKEFKRLKKMVRSE